MQINNTFAHSESLELLGPNHLEHIKSINNLARIYKLKGKLIDAKYLYIDALKRAYSQDKVDYNLVGTLHENLGEVYRELEDHKLAIIEYEKALEFNQKYTLQVGGAAKKFNPRYVVIEIARANIYKDLKEYDKSQQLYQILQNYLEKFPNLTPKTYASFYYNYADFLKEIGEDEKSENYFEKALSFSNNLPFEQSKIYEKLGELAFIEDNTDKGFLNLDKAIELCPSNMELRKIQLNIELFDKFANSDRPIDHIEIELKTSLEINKFETAVLSNNLKNTSTFHLREIIDYYKVRLSTHDLGIEERIKTYKLISHAIMGLVTYQYFQDSQFQLLGDVRDIVYDAVECLLEASENEAESWDEALYFIELGKSILFNIESRNQDQVSNNKFQNRITELNYILKNPSIGDDTKGELLKEISDLTDSLLINENTVVLNFPFDTQDLSSFVENKNILSYLIREDHIYLCSKIDDRRVFKKIKMNPVDQSLCFDLSEECKMFSKSLIPSDLIHSQSSLHISPDGWLSSFPFDLMFYGDAHLISQIDIVYSYSFLSDLKNSLKSKSSHKSDYFFQLPLSEFSEIHYSNEFAEIGEYFNEYFTDESCTKDNFTDALVNGNIIHLSSHSESNSDTSLAFLKFANRSLSLYDIYSLKIDPNLLVLSSCNNELGEFNPGEGSNSLGRAFYYAGAQNIVSSLWELNEKSTASIYKQFYIHLNNGYHASKALQLAKINYLKNVKSDRERHPYYWAGIVCIGGDMSGQSIKLGESYTSKFILIILLLLVFLFLFRKLRN